MRKMIFAAIIAGSLCSCSKEAEVAEKDSCAGDIDLKAMAFPQQWKLVKMTGNMMNSETTGNDMSWQEYILLNQDGSFVKHREENNQLYEATGTYSFALTNDRFIELTLTYPAASNLVGSCYGQNLEKYHLTSKCKLVGTWAHCDGPGLEYARQ